MLPRVVLALGSRCIASGFNESMAFSLNESLARPGASQVLSGADDGFSRIHRQLPAEFTLVVCPPKQVVLDEVGSRVQAVCNLTVGDFSLVILHNPL